MATNIDGLIQKALFYNRHHDAVPFEVIYANCAAMGYSELVTEEALGRMVSDGKLRRIEMEDSICYAKIEDY